MKIIGISDTHGKHKLIPKEFLENADGLIDVIICSGDISEIGYRTEIINFLGWFNNLPFKHKILIGGNHDFFLENASNEDLTIMFSEYPNVIYLNDSGCEIDGVKFWGSPVQPYFHNWAFNKLGTDICKHWNKIPLDTNVLITHGPPEGILDENTRGLSVGCPYLLEKIGELTNLKLHIFGHIHEGYGSLDNGKGLTFVNASLLDFRYYMTNNPITIEI